MDIDWTKIFYAPAKGDGDLRIGAFSGLGSDRLARNLRVVQKGLGDAQP